jgi:hypothetical protein
MLRVEMQDGNGTLVMRLYGRLTAEYGEQIRTLLTQCNPETKLIVDLTELTFADAVGEEVLASHGRVHGEFIAENLYAKNLCERLQLPLARGRRRRREVKGT